jgi:predicted component of type VI protein secretion system
MKAELVPDNGDPPIPILRDVTIVGRHPDCDVVINEVSLSKRHCVFVKTDGLLVIRDLATTNGTKVKGQKVRWAALLPDDKISLGGFKMRVYLGSDEMPSPSEQRRARQGTSIAGPRDLKAGPGAESLSRSSKRGDVLPPPVFPQSITSAFPAPSYHDTVLSSLANKEAGGQDAGTGSPESDAMLANFELINDDDDDDDIIDLP